METAGIVGLRAGFAAIVAVMLAIDLFVVGGGRERRVSFREAATWSVVRIAITLAFAGGLWWHLDGILGREIGNTKALEFITGYLIEKALAVDDAFVWLMLFGFLRCRPNCRSACCSTACSAPSSCVPSWSLPAPG